MRVSFDLSRFTKEDLVKAMGECWHISGGEVTNDSVHSNGHEPPMIGTQS